MSCHTLPLFTQTHQRQRRIQIVLMDFPLSSSLSLYHILSHIPISSSRSASWHKNKTASKTKSKKKMYVDREKWGKSSGMSLAQYLYFTQFLLTTAIMSE